VIKIIFGTCFERAFVIFLSTEVENFLSTVINIEKSELFFDFQHPQ